MTIPEKSRLSCSPQSSRLKPSSLGGGRTLSHMDVENLSMKASKLDRAEYRELPAATRAKYRATVRRHFHELLATEPSWIYIIINPAWPTFCKIGITKNIKLRLKNYRVSSPFGDFRCVHAEYFYDNAQYINDIYEHFGDFRAHGEWFEIPVAEASAYLTKVKAQSDAV